MTFPLELLSSRLSVVGGGALTQACSGEGSARGHRSGEEKWKVLRLLLEEFTGEEPGRAQRRKPEPD